MFSQSNTMTRTSKASDRIKLQVIIAEIGNIHRFRNQAPSTHMAILVRKLDEVKTIMIRSGKHYLWQYLIEGATKVY